MIHLGEVCAGAVTVLQAGLPAANSQGRAYKITRGQWLNRNPALTPWIGLYPASQGDQPGFIANLTNPWQSTVRIYAVVQTSTAIAHANDGATAQDLMEEAVAAVNAALLADLTLNGTVRHIVGQDAEYRFIDPEQARGQMFAEARITLTCETRS